MPPVRLAKLRSSYRREEEGAVLFIVAMILAVLASVGLFALAAASTEIRTSGNERQNTQTHYLAEYGMLAAANNIQGRPDFYDSMSIRNPDWPCLSLPGVSQTADPLLRSCWRIEQIDLTQGWLAGSGTVPYDGQQPYTGTRPGSLGPTPMLADFFVELTAPTQKTAPSRYALDLHFCFHEYTATAVGITRPIYQQQTNTLVGAYISEGQEMQRARFIIGPSTDCQ
jgi:hypothetical protein